MQSSWSKQNYKVIKAEKHALGKTFRYGDGCETHVTENPLSKWKLQDFDVWNNILFCDWKKLQIMYNNLPFEVMSLSLNSIFRMLKKKRNTDTDHIKHFHWEVDRDT